MSDSILSPRADRTQLQQIIVGLTEGIIIINPDQAIAWANDAALAMHGIASIKELGSTVSDYRKRFQLRYRNRHILPEGEYPMDRVVAGEAFTEGVVEVARLGDEKHWVHRIRSLVLTDAKGHPDCLVLVMEDETERFSAEARFERTFGANPAPALIVRLSDMRFVKVNQGFLEMTGYTREALIGRSLHEIDILEGAEKRHLAIERLHAGTTIPQMEAKLKLPDAASRTVILAGQPLDIGDAACMLFSFADLHPRTKVEQALRQSEERFAKAFRMAPVPMAIVVLDGLRLLDVNDAFTAVTGWRREEIVGRDEPDLALWGTSEASKALEQQIKQDGHVHSVEIQLRNKDGKTCDYLFSAERVMIHHEQCVLTVMQDITERKQLETQLLSAIEAVMQDTSWFGQKIVEKLATLSRSSGTSRLGPETSTLSARGREVLDLVAQGLPDQEIAEKLGVTRNTIRNHVSAIYSRLGVHRRSAVIVWARERGLGAKSNPLKKPSKSKRRPPR